MWQNALATICPAGGPRAPRDTVRTARPSEPAARAFPDDHRDSGGRGKKTCSVDKEGLAGHSPPPPPRALHIKPALSYVGGGAERETGILG